MQARRCGKEEFEKRHNMMQYQYAIPERRYTRMLYPDDAITKGFTYKQAGMRIHGYQLAPPREKGKPDPCHSSYATDTCTTGCSY